MPELWASVKKLRSSRLYCDEEAGLAQDSHWIAEPQGSERSTGSAVQVAVRHVGGLPSTVELVIMNGHRWTPAAMHFDKLFNLRGTEKNLSEMFQK